MFAKVHRQKVSSSFKKCHLRCSICKAKFPLAKVLFLKVETETEQEKQSIHFTENKYAFSRFWSFSRKSSLKKTDMQIRESLCHAKFPRKQIRKS